MICNGSDFAGLFGIGLLVGGFVFGIIFYNLGLTEGRLESRDTELARLRKEAPDGQV